MAFAAHGEFAWKRRRDGVQHAWKLKWALKLNWGRFHPAVCSHFTVEEYSRFPCSPPFARLLPVGGCCYVSALCSPAAQLWTNPCWLFRDHMGSSLRPAPREGGSASAGVCYGQQRPPPANPLPLPKEKGEKRLGWVGFEHVRYIHKHSIKNKLTAITSSQQTQKKIDSFSPLQYSVDTSGPISFSLPRCPISMYTNNL